jgi:hypothetical protein
MANRHNSPWDAELVARAAGLKRAGFSAKAIAKRLGVTSKAVEGKMFRTGAKSPPYLINKSRPIREQGK